MKSLFLLLLLFCQNILAEEMASMRYEDEVAMTLNRADIPGEKVWLTSVSGTFLALFIDGIPDYSTRAIIILHSMGSHADWPEIISPLRTGLPEYGWTTLSIQLPLLAPRVSPSEYSTTFVEANGRIQSAVQYLLSRQYQDIVIIGYSFGATTALNYLTEHAPEIKGVVGISLQQHPFFKSSANLFSMLGKAPVPVLDIYGSLDYLEVIRSAPDRRLAVSKNGITDYVQLMVDGADHYFTGKNNLLTNHIIEWLDNLVPYVEDDPMRGIYSNGSID